MSTPFLVAALLVIAALAATAYIAAKSDIPPLPRVLRFALELAVFAVGLIVLDSAITGFHLNVAPIGRDEGAGLLAAYAILTVIPAWRRMNAASKNRD